MPSKTSSFSHEHCRQSVLDYIANRSPRPLKRQALVRALEIPVEHHPAFRRLVSDMLADGSITLGAGRTLVVPDASATRIGVLKLDRRGFGFVAGRGHAGVRIPRGKTGDALDGDTVSVRISRTRSNADVPTGRVISVLRESERRCVGTLAHSGNRWLVHPQGDRRAATVEVDPPKPNQARAGDLVVVELTRSTVATRTPRGVLIERIGRASSPAAMITGVLRRFGIPEEFPADVLREAKRAAKDPKPREIERRVDLRGLLTITIDPVDARDFDDAISLTQLADGRCELGVHIADVAHFVQPGTHLDDEARSRGTSVYLPGRVVPMLPEELSNGVCSLQEGRPRLTKSAFIVYDKNARVIGARFSNSLIESRKRLTYEQVDRLLDGKGRATAAIRGLIQRAEQLARLIRARRLRDGMLVLNMPEIELQLDKNGAVRDAHPADGGFSHTVIEMFMVEANDAVSRKLNKMNVPHLRRIHPAPDAETLRLLNDRLRAADCATAGSLDRAGLQRLLDSARGETREYAVNLLLLRSFGQAVYSPEPAGHFALASEHYCHFTSPIRRYPDLTIHRLFDQWLADGPRAKRTKNAAERFEALGETGRQLSTLERRAQEAERSAKTLLLLDMMKSKIGETFEGVVTGVVARGVFVRIVPLGAEGFVRVTDLPDDRWFHSREDATLTGRRTGRTIAIGQPLRVVVEAVDRHARDMSLVPADDKIGTVKGSAGHRGRAREPVSSKRRSRPPKGRRSRER
ncbi:MAG: ribonuclease R [Planctomycetes bacterium]|nr:ribonuclease R [Planctomycetota bacterium]